ncbi:MAG: hypothetical protein KC777_09235 [Cyanobacteria bacterium HKST-UBA02]|nr:hypothetical protein [Cyanobacteria bacterium HKST-UBA02]
MDEAPAPGERQHKKIDSLLLLPGLCFLLLIAQFACHPFWIAPEPAMYVDMVGMLTRGEHPYVFEPAMLVTSTVPAILAALLPSALPVIYFGYILLLALASASASLYLLKRAQLPYLAAILLVTGFAAINNLFVFQLGEHEHLLLILTMPYILLRWLRGDELERAKSEQDSSSQPPDEPDWRLCAAAGVASGIGFCLHMLYLSLPLLLELVPILRSGRAVSLRKPESIACISTMALIALSVVLFDPSFFDLVVPVVLANWQVLDLNLGQVAYSPDHNRLLLLCFAAFVPALACLGRTSLVTPLFTMAIMGLMFLTAQKHGFTGDTILAGGMALTLLGLSSGMILSEFCLPEVRTSASKLASKLAISVAVLAALVGVIAAFTHSLLTGNSLESALAIGKLPADNTRSIAEFVELRSSIGDGILVLNDTVAPSYPMVWLKGRHIVDGITGGMPLRALLAAAAKDTSMQEALATYKDRIKKVITSKTARLILIQDGINYEWLLAQPELKEALDKDYRPVGMAKYGYSAPPYYGYGSWYDFAVYERVE